MAGEVLPMVTRGGGRVTGDEEGLRQEFDGELEQMMEKIARGSMGAEGVMVAAHSEPSSPEQNNRSGGGSGSRGVGQEGREGKWDEHGLEKLVDKRTEAKRECSVHATAAASCQPGSAPGGRGMRRNGQQRDGERREDVGATRGGMGKQEVSRGGAAAGGTAATGAALCAGCREKQQGYQGKKKGEGVRGTGLQITKILGAYR
jgi:hypothetical protein